MVRHLDYQDSARANVLINVLNELINITTHFPSHSEMHSLRQWARTMTPQDYKSLQTDGFGLAGFQYLRMLFSADTVKPDIYIKRFVKECIGRGLSDMTAVKLIEGASQQLGCSTKRIDELIWGDYASKKKRGTGYNKKCKN